MHAECNITPSARSRHGLDWFNFFAADVRTGVGPFVAIYLTNAHWSVAHIGLALTAAELAGVITQAPGGALMDHIRSKRLMLAIAVVVLTLSALAMAFFPEVGIVIAAQTALGITGSLFGPGISAITLGLVTYACLGARTGRNAAFGSAGNVVAALSMGWIGYAYSTRAIFYLVALLSVPTLLALFTIRAEDIDYERARGGTSEKPDAAAGERGSKPAKKTAGLRDIFLRPADGHVCRAHHPLALGQCRHACHDRGANHKEPPQRIVALDVGRGYGAPAGDGADRSHGRKHCRQTWPEADSGIWLYPSALAARCCVRSRRTLTS